MCGRPIELQEAAGPDVLGVVALVAVSIGRSHRQSGWLNSRCRGAVSSYRRSVPSYDSSGAGTRRRSPTS
jgi:hypothetical protein